MGTFRRGMRAIWGLGLVFGQVVGCLPSQFNDLTQQADPATPCTSPDCLDASQAEPPALDGSLVDASLGDSSLGRADASADSGALVHDAEPPMTPPCEGDAVVCQASQPDQQMESCGSCGSGVRLRTRSCAADGCSWGAWSEWSECTGQQAECDPGGPAEQRSVGCTTCGSKTQSRTCSAETCSWGAWTDTSACSWCEQCAEVVYCDTPANIASRGTWCRQKACSREQALADCKEDVEGTCGSMIQPFYMEYQ
jgi:hypothetical protein